MSNKRRLRYLWCTLMGGLVFISILPESGWMCQIVGGHDLNRWVHFLAYGTMVAVPFIVWRSRTDIWLPLILVATGIALEFLQRLIPGSNVQVQNALADLFGVAAGILLGLNLRAMRASPRPANKLDSNRSRSTFT